MYKVTDATRTSANGVKFGTYMVVELTSEEQRTYSNATCNAVLPSLLTNIRYRLHLQVNIHFLP